MHIDGALAHHGVMIARDPLTVLIGPVLILSKNLKLAPFLKGEQFILRHMTDEKVDAVRIVNRQCPEGYEWRRGGLDAVKTQLQEAIEAPLRNPQLLLQSGLPTNAGVLLYGPSGTGKTLLAKAIANECGVNFISVNGAELFTKWLGETEEDVRQIFRVHRGRSPHLQ